MSTVAAAPLVQTVIWPPEPLTLQVSEPRTVSWLVQAAMSDAGAWKPEHIVAEIRAGSRALRRIDCVESMMMDGNGKTASSI